MSRNWMPNNAGNCAIGARSLLPKSSGNGWCDSVAGDRCWARIEGLLKMHVDMAFVWNRRRLVDEATRRRRMVRNT